MSKSIQKRVVFNADAKLKFTKSSDTSTEKIGTLSGYAIVYNVVSNDRGGYSVRLLPKSATFATPTLAYFQHDPKAVIGNTANGTLRIFTDDVGVRVEIDLPDTSVGRDVEELVENGYVSGMSFAMNAAPDYMVTVENGKRIVNAKSYVVGEVTVTACPAFSETSVTLLEDDITEDDDIPEDDDEPVNAQKLSDANRQESVRLERLKLQFMQL